MKKYTDVECHQLFQKMFHDGFVNREIIDILAPTGWENSPLIFAIHPTAEMIYKNSVESYDFSQKLFDTSERKEREPMETWEEFLTEYVPRTDIPNTETDIQELVARCVLEVFGESNKVIKDDKQYYLGEVHEVSQFLVQVVNSISAKQYDDTDFIMGTVTMGDCCDLTPVYQLIFSRFKQVGCEWFFGKLDIESLSFLEHFDVDEGDFYDPIKDSPENYNPNMAFEKELEYQKKQKTKAEIIANLERMYEQDKEDALYKPPPSIIQAYKNVFGKLPKGWPQS